MRASLVLTALAVAACPASPRVAPPPELAAVVETRAGLALWRGREGSFRPVATLPRDARALRFAPDGRDLAFVEDDPPRMRVDALVGGALRIVAPDAPFRRLQAFGLAIDDRGRTWILGPTGEDREVVASPSGATLSVAASDCLVSVPSALPDVCGAALRPLALAGRLALARTNAALLLLHNRSTESLPMTGIVSAAFGPRDQVLVLRRANDGPQVEDEVVLVSPWPRRRVLLRAPLVVSVSWDAGGNVLAVRRTLPVSLVASLLAHAPDEFGGEAIGGEAVHIQLPTGTVSPVHGLERQTVRALAGILPNSGH